MMSECHYDIKHVTDVTLTIDTQFTQLKLTRHTVVHRVAQVVV